MSLTKKQQQETILDGYREQARNSETEQEALDWCEALISDCAVAGEAEPEVRRDPKLK